jgi:dienelactone hydrolase
MVVPRLSRFPYSAHHSCYFFFRRRPKPRLNVQTGFCWMGCLAVTYFRERKLTIIGALLFHGPVREGKGWVQQAIAAKRNL